MRNISSIIAIFILSSCIVQTDKKINDLSDNKDIHIINIDQISPQKEIKLSSLFKNAKIIILENKDDIFIGNIDKMYVYHDSILILDRRIAKGLFIFNKQGKFLKKIGDVGKGPGEFHTPQDFTVNEETKELYILDSHMDKINKYDLQTGKYISTVRLNDKGKIRSFYIQCVDGKLYSDAYFAMPSKDNYLLKEIDLINGKEKGRWLNKVKYNKGWDEIFFLGESPFVPNGPKSSKYIQLFMDEVVAISSGKINPFLRLKSKDLVQNKDLRASSKNDANLRYSNLYKLNKIYGIHNYIEFRNKILFQYYHGNLISTVLYDITKRTADIYYNVVDDLISNSDDPKERLYPEFVFFDKQNVYSHIKSNQMPKFIKLIKDNLLNLYLGDGDELLQLTNDSNPIIVYYF